MGIKTNGVPAGADQVVNGSIGFAYTDGKTASNTLYRNGTALAVKQTASSLAASEVLQVWSNANQKLLSIANNGAIQLTNIQASAVPASQDKRIPVYNAADGTLAGYIPLYN